jgi:hypothetical protein
MVQAPVFCGINVEHSGHTVKGNVVSFLLGSSPVSEFYIPTFRNTLFHLHRRIGMKNDWVW